MALFRKQRDPWEVKAAGKFACSECGRLLPLTDYPPLVADKCGSCKRTILIPKIIGDFYLFDPLGVGGMGSVYKSLRRGFEDQEFAVKVLPRGKLDDEMLIEKLQEEAEISDRLRFHPCLANMVDYGYKDGEHFLAMEFIKGERIDNRIERLGKLPEEEVLLIGLRLLSAEAHIFNRGYLFRDMKPQNAIYTEDHGAFLFDFGICMPLHAAATYDGDTIVGSPIYFPPERILGEGERGRSEIYSLGMVLYHSLTGQPYFSATEIQQIARQHVSSARLSSLKHKMKNISPDIAEIVDRMIRRDMSERYQSFNAVERDLLDALRRRKHPQAS